MKGSTFKRTLPSGKVDWVLSIDVGRDQNGKRLRIFKGGFRRKSDADDELVRLLQEKSEGLLVKPDPRTFGEFIDEWFREHAEKHCGEETVERYRQLVAYVQPTLADVPLRDISALMLERLYSRIAEFGGRKKRRLKKGEKPESAPLSWRTVRHVADVVRAALNTAVRWKLLKVNPACACDLPTARTKEARALDETQTDWFLTAGRGHWLYCILFMDAATGARRGEILALTWTDLDLECEPGVVTISKSLSQTRQGLAIKPPKSGRTRMLPLPAIVVEALREHQAQQQELRRKFGPDYNTELNLVFGTPEGDYLKPDSVTVAASLLARKSGLKGIGLHSLRHSHGSQLLSAGVPLPTVSKRLGHSSVAVTASIYSHAFKRDENAAAEIWDTSMRKAMDSPRVKQ